MRALYHPLKGTYIYIYIYVYIYIYIYGAFIPSFPAKSQGEESMLKKNTKVSGFWASDLPRAYGLILFGQVLTCAIVAKQPASFRLLPGGLTSELWGGQITWDHSLNPKPKTIKTLHPKTP